MDRRDKAEQKRTARERIKKLFGMAGEAGEQARADRYASMARKMAMRYNVRLTPGQRRKMCRECQAYLVPGRNARVRMSKTSGNITITCLKCGHVARYPGKK